MRSNEIRKSITNHQQELRTYHERCVKTEEELESEDHHFGNSKVLVNNIPKKESTTKFCSMTVGSHCRKSVRGQVDPISGDQSTYEVMSNCRCANMST